MKTWAPYLQLLVDGLPQVCPCPCPACATGPCPCPGGTDGHRRYDVILDIGGNRPLSRLRRALTPRGRLVIVGGENGGRWLGGTDRQIRARLLSLLVRQQLGTFINKENARDLTTLRDMIDAGTLTPAVDRTYQLEESLAAIRHLVDGHARGKIVIAIHDADAR